MAIAKRARCGCVHGNILSFCFSLGVRKRHLLFTELSSFLTDSIIINYTRPIRAVYKLWHIKFLFLLSLFWFVVMVKALNLITGLIHDNYLCEHQSGNFVTCLFIMFCSSRWNLTYETSNFHILKKAASKNIVLRMFLSW